MNLASYRRDVLGLSQEALAQRLGLKSKSIISEIESGRRPASLRIALKIERMTDGAIKAADLNAQAAELDTIQ